MTFPAPVRALWGLVGAIAAVWALSALSVATNAWTGRQPANRPAPSRSSACQKIHLDRHVRSAHVGDGSARSQLEMFATACAGTPVGRQAEDAPAALAQSEPERRVATERARRRDGAPTVGSLGRTPILAAKTYFVQAGAFGNAAEAERERRRLSRRHPELVERYGAEIRPARLKGHARWRRLLIGPLSDRDLAASVSAGLEAEGLDAFVVAAPLESPSPRND
jgi:hypothetical protein